MHILYALANTAVTFSISFLYAQYLTEIEGPSVRKRLVNPLLLILSKKKKRKTNLFITN